MITTQVWRDVALHAQLKEPLERDITERVAASQLANNDLWLRAHPGTLDGRKGRAPLGRRYLLLNAELYKTVCDGAFFRVQLGPFLTPVRSPIQLDYLAHGMALRHWDSSQTPRPRQR